MEPNRKASPAPPNLQSRFKKPASKISASSRLPLPVRPAPAPQQSKNTSPQKTTPAAHGHTSRTVASTHPLGNAFALLPSKKKEAPTTKKQRSKLKQPDTLEPTKTVEIKIGLPQLPKINVSKQLRKVSRAIARFSKRQLATGVVAGVIIVATILLATHHHRNGSNTAATGNKGSSSGHAALQKGNPPYATIVPAGKSIDSLGGWTRVSPPDRNPVYAYVDKIGAVQISVSEQPLPDDFQESPDKLAQLAQSYTANDKLAVDGVTAYIGTSAKGPQSVIVSKKKLLILMKSTAPLPDAQWSAYISSLE